MTESIVERLLDIRYRRFKEKDRSAIVYAATEITRLRGALEEINSQAICFAIATEDECCKMLENCARISEKALSYNRQPTDALGQTASEVYSPEVLDAMTRVPNEEGEK